MVNSTTVAFGSESVKQVLYKRAVSFVFYILTVTIQGALIIHPFHFGYRYTGTLANSEDQDEMPHKAIFHQGLHCLIR